MESDWRNVVAVAPSGQQAAVGLNHGQLLVVDLKTGRLQPLGGFPPGTGIGEVAFSSDGHLLAATPGIGPRAEKVVRVFNLDDCSVRVFGPLPGTKEGYAGSVRSLAFAGADCVVALVEDAGLVSVDLRSGAMRLLADGPNRRYRLGPDGVSGVGLRSSPDGSGSSVVPFRVDGGAAPVLPSYENPTEVALDPSGTLVATGGADGVVRIGRLAGGEPHILFGQRGPVRLLAFSPDGRWLASGADDIRIWPVPDVSRTPLHKLPHEELLSRLRLYTNLRAVVDESAIGYALKPGPFPGWATPPPQ